MHAVNLQHVGRDLSSTAKNQSTSPHVLSRLQKHNQSHGIHGLCATPACIRASEPLVRHCAGINTLARGLRIREQESFGSTPQRLRNEMDSPEAVPLYHNYLLRIAEMRSRRGASSRDETQFTSLIRRAASHMPRTSHHSNLICHVQEKQKIARQLRSLRIN